MHIVGTESPMLSLVLTFDHHHHHSAEDDVDGYSFAFAFFNQLLELYSSTFSTTTILDMWVDQEFAGTDGYD